MAGTADVTGQQYYTLGIGHTRIPQREAPPSTSYVIEQFGLPVILAPSGTVATNGTITLGTALQGTYDLGAWVYLPAGAIVGGLAGLYFTVFSSTTVGVVSTTFSASDITTPFAPYIPANIVMAVGSNSAYTQTTATDITLALINIPAAMMGPNGAFRYSAMYTYNNSVGVKTLRVKFATDSVVSLTPTTTVTQGVVGIVRNNGAVNKNSSFNTASGTGASGSPLLRFTINTDVDQPLIFTCQLATATDYAVLEGLTVEVMPSNA